MSGSNKLRRLRVAVAVVGVVMVTIAAYAKGWWTGSQESYDTKVSLNMGLLESEECVERTSLDPEEVDGVITGTSGCRNADQMVDRNLGTGFNFIRTALFVDSALLILSICFALWTTFFSTNTKLAKTACILSAGVAIVGFKSAVWMLVTAPDGLTKDPMSLGYCAPMYLIGAVLSAAGILLTRATIGEEDQAPAKLVT